MIEFAEVLNFPVDDDTADAEFQQIENLVVFGNATQPFVYAIGEGAFGDERVCHVCLAVLRQG
ncbi:hypothetical protein D3C86_2151980 [compost metagenome]